MAKYEIKLETKDEMFGLVAGKWFVILTVFYIFIVPFNWLPKDSRYFGYQNIWYDGPNYSFGFWWWNINWGYDWCGAYTRKKNKQVTP